MAQITWKLVVTSLSGESDAREAVVQADNWLSALRLARKQVGEEGGVPPGASCVMSAAGEVTILDPAQRKRYLLTRSNEGAVPPAEAPSSPSLPSASTSASSATTVTAAKAPAPAHAASAPKPDAGTVRRATVAYSPQESAAVRAQLAAARAAATQSSTASLATADTIRPPDVGASPTVEASVAEAASPAPQNAEKPLAPAQGSAAAAAIGARVPNLSNPAPALAAAPASAPSGASTSPTKGPVRSTTLAYSPEESEAIRAQLMAAQKAKAAAQVGPHAAPTPAPTNDAPKPAASAAPTPASTNATPPPASPAQQPARRVMNTLAYSPEEAAAARAQLLAAQKAMAAQQPSPAQAPASAQPQAAAPAQPPATTPAQPQSAAFAQRQSAPPQQTPAAAPAAQAPRKNVTVAYMESPFVGGVLVAQSSRSEDPSATSPLSYRERTYVVTPNADRARIEAALRGELARIQAELAGRPRGQYVNLAVFDHTFTDRPLRPPIATLQWKDWRGTPVYWQGSSQSAPPWAGPDEPIRTSFVPGATDAPAVSVPQAAAAPAPTTTAAQASAARLAASRDGTGEQDRRLAVAFEAVQDLYFLATPAEGLDFAVKLLGELVPCEAISGAIYDINTDEFRFVAATGPSAEERRGSAVASSVGLLSAAMRSGKEHLVVADAGNDPRFDARADGRTGLIPRNLAYLTLHKNDIWLGMLQLINRQNPRGFTDGDMAVASYVASQVLEFLLQRRAVSARRR